MAQILFFSNSIVICGDDHSESGSDSVTHRLFKMCVEELVWASSKLLQACLHEHNAHKPTIHRVLHKS